MSDLLDRATFANLSGDSAALDPDRFGDAYLSAVFSAVQAELGAYLGYAPALSVHQDEEGPVDFFSSGPYAGRYKIGLKHRPLVPGDASDVFSDLKLTYALAFAQNLTDVALQYVTLDHSTAQVYVLAPGSVEALAPAMSFAYAPTPGIRAVAFRATYAAGYSTGISETVRPDHTSYNAPPLPEDLRLAAAYLCIERLQMQAQAAQSSSVSLPTTGPLTRIRVGEREQAWAPMAARQGGQWAVGFGSTFGQMATSLLDKHRKRPAPALV